MTKKPQNKRHPLLREFIARCILVLSDFILVFLTIFAVFLLEGLLDNEYIYFYDIFIQSLVIYPAYIIVLAIFFYEGIYVNRYDFWEESRLVLKSLFFSFVTIIAYSVLVNDMVNYPVEIILVSFLIMTLSIPLFKYFMKISLFKMGLWKKGVKILSNNAHLENEVFGNPYLGYIRSKRKDAELVFVDSHNMKASDLKRTVEKEILEKKKVLFIPVFNSFQFTHSNIYELSNVRTNLIVLENRLKSKIRLFVNISYNFVLGFLLLPFLLPIVAIIALLIKRDSKGPVFYTQKRLGKDGEEFDVLKFRTMYTDDVQKKLLGIYLEENPQEVENYRIYAKYENDPRITKIGHFLRKTSLDELAQILNVVKSDMNLVGPRPYMVSEKEKMGTYNKDVILKVKPGITGLWQVSGRNELTFDERVELEKWYVQNWSLWRDFVILIKTVGVVLNKVGAK